MSTGSQSDLAYWLAWHKVPLIGAARLTKIITYFPDLKTAWIAPRTELVAAGLPLTVVDQIIHERPLIDPLAELALVENSGLALVTITDPAYPPLLKEIHQPPPLLFVRGTLPTSPHLAVVGRRKLSGYGRIITNQLTADLARAGLVIVSGLALGADTVAHAAALSVQGTTIAVIGCGADIIYPSSNRRLADEIIAGGGAIISEFALGTPPYTSNFPQRNRIIAGLSLGVVITEAAIHSGALITAQHAVEQNRDVFAVPGSILEPGSVGPHQLIQKGAQLVTTAAEILTELGYGMSDPAPTELWQAATELERQIVRLLQNGPLHVDKLVQLSRLDIMAVNAALTVMELQGGVTALEGHTYCLRR